VRRVRGQPVGAADRVSDDDAGGGSH
jgi:hypothetical protein